MHINGDIFSTRIWNQQYEMSEHEVYLQDSNSHFDQNQWALGCFFSINVTYVDIYIYIFIAKRQKIPQISVNIANTHICVYIYTYIYIFLGYHRGTIYIYTYIDNVFCLSAILDGHRRRIRSWMPSIASWVRTPTG